MVKLLICLVYKCYYATRTIYFNILCLTYYSVASESILDFAETESSFDDQFKIKYVLYSWIEEVYASKNKRWIEGPNRNPLATIINANVELYG